MDGAEHPEGVEVIVGVVDVVGEVCIHNHFPFFEEISVAVGMDLCAGLL